MASADRRLFAQLNRRFETRLKDTIAEIRAEDADDQDWSRIERQFLVFGTFLEEQEPEAAVLEVVRR